MNLLVFHPDSREIIGRLEKYQSLRWTRRLYSAGDFEIKLQQTDDIKAELIAEDNILIREGDTEPAEIEDMHVEDYEDASVIVKGRFTLGESRKRIILGREVFNGALEACIAQLLNNHVISPADVERTISGIAYIPIVTGKTILTERSYRNVEDVMCELCRMSGVGIRCDFNPRTKIFTVTLFIGNERPIVFSIKDGTMMGCSYDYSSRESATFALIGGEGEGQSRILTTTGGGSGRHRREIFVDASNLRSEDFADSGIYTQALQDAGEAKLQKRAVINSFDAEVHQYGSVRYGVDYDLGDLVTVRDRLYETTVQVPVVEVTETYDENGTNVDVVLGEGLPTMSDKLKSANS